jgi:hypothetical protein
VDVDSSLAFRRAHIAGARFVAASALEDLLERIEDSSRQLVLTSSDGILAGLLADQLRGRREDVAALLGGTQRWLALGLPQSAGDEGNFTGDDDAWYSPYHYAPAESALQMKAYLAWELQLVDQVERDGIASINVIDFKTSTHGRSEERLASLRRAS